MLLEFLVCKFYEVGPVGRGRVAILMLAEGYVPRVDESAHGREGGCPQTFGAQQIPNGTGGDSGHEHTLRVLPGVAWNIDRIGEQGSAADEDGTGRHQGNKFMTIHRHFGGRMT